MDQPIPKNPNAWSEENSRQFIDYGRYFVPERERQIQMMVDLVPRLDRPCHIVELCCGEGLLAQALLERFEAATVLGLDGSQEMLLRARQRLDHFGDRFQTQSFDLAERSWRGSLRGVDAVISSLAIHHLTGPQKQELFRDVYQILAEGGVLVIADMIAPASQCGMAIAADAWDQAVRERSLKLDGSTDGFAFFERERWNTYRYPDPDDIDKPSSLLDQFKWLEDAGFVEVDVHWMLAGHAIFSGWKMA